MAESGRQCGGALQGCQRVPVVDLSRCDRCGLCAEACPCGAIDLTARGLAFRCGSRCHIVEHCVALAQGFYPCESACPAGAIQGCFDIVLPYVEPEHPDA